MTEKQIAELRQTAAAASEGNGMAGVDRYCAVIGHEDLTRLLDERQALVEAVRFSLYTKVEDGYEELERLEAALAFAAEPLEIDPVHRP